jgi:TRAP-type mannitol/chloroaromatic compound transport system permease small subunit
VVLRRLETAAKCQYSFSTIKVLETKDINKLPQIIFFFRPGDLIAGFFFYLAAGVIGNMSYSSLTYRGTQKIYIALIVLASLSVIMAFAQVGVVLSSISLGRRKNIQSIVKVWYFLNLIFMSVRILSFDAIHSVIKKMLHKGPVAANEARQK